jgi:pimeloyl-ACP methyl ester carboxylesterase
MEAIYDLAPEPVTDRIMLVMLPGAKAGAQDLVQQGFVRALRERRLPVDVVAVDAHLGYYLERSLSSHLTDDILAPARARNYRRIWLMGISLGGMGALIYASEHPSDIEGVILLAPFLGARGTIAEVVRAGGLAQWQPGAIKADDDERQLLAWIKAYPPAAAAPPGIYLGYGTNDRFAAASNLLAQRLPAAQVVTIAGGHDWATWLHLWQRWLDRGLFCSDEKVMRRRVTVANKNRPLHDVR